MRQPALLLTLAAAALAGGCGAEQEPRPETRAATPLPAARTVEKDPYAITCGHVRDQLEWGRLTRRATVAIADRERVPGLNRLRLTQSLFYAMTELCKGQPAQYRPAEEAVQGVRKGVYVADLSAP